MIALCQAEHEMAESADDKVRIAGQLVEKLTAAGVPLDDIYIDPLVYPLSTNPKSAKATLDAIGMIMKKFPAPILRLRSDKYFLRPAREKTGSTGPFSQRRSPWG